MNKFFTNCAIFSFLTVLSVEAQFHQKSPSTGTSGARPMNNPYSGRAPESAAGATAPGVERVARPNFSGEKKINAVVINPEVVSRAVENAQQQNMKITPKIDQAWMDIKNADVWGRSENHTDGTYTEEVFDLDPDKPRQREKVLIQTPYGEMPATQITQITRKRRTDGVDAKEDPIVMIRKIALDMYGNPEQVWIFDGKGQYRYHGLFVYDVRGRLIEEQIRDTKGKPIRRVIQEYDALGKPKSLKNVDYVKDVPKDLILVQSDPMNELMESKLNRLEKDAEELAGFKGFKRWKQKAAERRELQKQDQREEPPVLQGSIPTATAIQPTEKKGFQFFRNRD